MSPTQHAPAQQVACHHLALHHPSFQSCLCQLTVRDCQLGIQRPAQGAAGSADGHLLYILYISTWASSDLRGGQVRQMFIG